MNLQEITNGVGTTALILGLPGAGKTSSIRNMSPESTIILTSEPHGLRTLLQYGWGECRVYDPSTPSEWEDAVLKAQQEDASDVVIDTLSSCHDLFLQDYIDQAKKQGKRVDQLGLDMYRVANLRFQEILRKLFETPLQGKNLIMTCHLKYREDNGTQLKEPALSDNLTNWIARQCSMILRAEKVELGNKTKYKLLSKGACGDYGSDKTGVVKDIEENDIQAILSRLKPNDINANNPLEEKPIPEKVEKKEKTFQSNRPPERTKRGAYQGFIEMAIERAPTLSKKEVHAWLEEQSGKKLALISVDQYKTLTKKFNEQFGCPF